MKKILFLLIPLSLFPSLISHTAWSNPQYFDAGEETLMAQRLNSAEKLEFLTGTWEGHYYCRQGLTKLRLDIRAINENNIYAIFNFSAHPQNRGVPTGSFEMEGRLQNSDQLILNGTQWLLRPSNYRTVNLNGKISFNDNSISGSVTPEGCGTFDLIRQTPFRRELTRNETVWEREIMNNRANQEKREAFFLPNNWRAWQGVSLWKLSNERNFERYRQVTASDGRSFAVGIARYECNDCGRFRGGGVNLLEEQINPRLQTTFYTHGWNSDHNSPNSAFFARTMGNASSVQQGVMVDWGQGSQTGLNLGLAASRIPIVAEALALRILESGLKPEEVDLVGHSLGAYVSVEAARILYQRYNFTVNSIILLDQANLQLIRYSPPSLNQLSPNTSTLAIFTNESFPVSTRTIASDAMYAQQAQKTIEIIPAVDPNAAHSSPNQLLSTTNRLGGSYRLDEIREVIKNDGSLAEYFRNENSRVFRLDENLALSNHVRLIESLF